jgi:ketosteroid isomerase-like protein
VAEFSRLEDSWNRAHLRGDADAIGQLMADDITVIVPKMPPFTKAESLSVLRSGHMRFDQYATSDLTIRGHDNCVVVTGRLKRTRTMGSRLLDDNWRFTKVYTRGPQAWQVVAFHASDAE